MLCVPFHAAALGWMHLWRLAEVVTPRLCLCHRPSMHPPEGGFWPGLFCFAIPAAPEGWRRFPGATRFPNHHTTPHPHEQQKGKRHEGQFP